MKLITTLALVALAGLNGVAAANAGSSGHAAAATPPCVPKYGKVGGVVVVDYCGPATATMKIGSKTYDFKDGYCSTNSKAHILLELTLGVIDGKKTPVNGGQPLFELQDLDTSGLKLTTVNADYDGKALDSAGTVTLKGSIPSDGTFTSSAFASPHFSGSWDCHGTVYAQ